jgi:hypothetical protein
MQWLDIDARTVRPIRIACGRAAAMGLARDSAERGSWTASSCAATLGALGGTEAGTEGSQMRPLDFADNGDVSLVVMAAPVARRAARRALANGDTSICVGSSDRCGSTSGHCQPTDLVA